MKIYHVILIILILLLIISGYFYSRINQENKELKLEILELNQEIYDLKEQAKVADWKTYSNNDYGFSFKYPSQFTLEDKLVKPEESSTASNYLRIKDDTAEEEPFLTIYLNPDGFGPFFPDIEYTIELSPEDTIEIVKKENSPPSEYNSASSKFIITSITKLGTHDYWFMYEFNEGSSDLTWIFDQILYNFHIRR